MAQAALDNFDYDGMDRQNDTGLLKKRKGDFNWRLDTQPSVREASPFVYQGIGISGKMGVGKTTLANYIEEGMGFERRALADALKTQVVDALVDNGIDCKRNELLGKYKSQIRGILQQWGVAFRYFNGEDYWVDCLFADNKAHLVVDDVRFPNELAALRQRGYLMVRLEADFNTRTERLLGLNFQQLDHESETALDNSLGLFDIVLNSQPTAAQTFATFKREASRFRFWNDLPNM